PGAYSEALALADRLGARLAWIPRRVGERAALEAGLLPGLAMGGHLTAALDAETAASLYGQAELASGGKSLTGILQAAAAGAIDTLLVGGLELSDLPDPALAIRAFESAKVVALQIQSSQLAPYADVMLPVAPPAEKPGTYINWEGRHRPFGQVLVSNVPSDAMVLQQLSQRLDVDTQIGQVATVHRLLGQLAPPKGRPPAPAVKPAQLPSLPKGQVLLSTWRYQLDESAGLAGQVDLAARAAKPMASVSGETAAELGISQGQPVRVASAFGAIVLPANITDMVSGVVHVPTKSPGSWVNQTLVASSGAVVQLAPAEAKEVKP
ncbi:MAG: molybdopterin-dependent oxidoreductase, partial [Micrococcales bacterium]|nr:molybdopterin-dependent oxidoreductase [Micrococcales bacterium]